MGNSVDVPLASLSPPRHAHVHHRNGDSVDSDGDGESDIDYGQPSGSGSGSNGSRPNQSTTTLPQNYRSRYAGRGDSPPFHPQHHHQHHYSQQHHPNRIEALKSRLSKIRHIEQYLISKLVPPNEEEPTHLGNGSIGGNVIHFSASSSRSGNGEVFVRPTSGWRGALARARVSYPSFLGDSSHSNGSGNSNGCEHRSRSIDVEATDETQETLHALCGDMIQLWQDSSVREVLKRRKIRLEEASGFFLNDLERVTSLRYMPSDGAFLTRHASWLGCRD
jgi:guanine nucleotide-binding protein subunit alpha